MPHVIHVECPPNCPTDEAMPYNGSIYRACRKFPALEVDMQSDAERDRPGKDKTICENWGLSVWTTTDGVAFARDAMSFTRRKYIVRFDVKESDGRLKQTPTGNQRENHFTFWKFQTANLSNASVYLEPVT